MAFFLCFTSWNESKASRTCFNELQTEILGVRISHVYKLVSSKFRSYNLQLNFNVICTITRYLYLIFHRKINWGGKIVKPQDVTAPLMNEVETY